MTSIEIAEELLRLENARHCGVSCKRDAKGQTRRIHVNLFAYPGEAPYWVVSHPGTGTDIVRREGFASLKAAAADCAEWLVSHGYHGVI